MLAPDTVRTTRQGDIVLPFFRVGSPEPDLAHYIALHASQKGNRR